MAPLATVGILSIGDMGMGIAKLLIAKNYRVVTNLEGRRYGTWFLVALRCSYFTIANLELLTVRLLLQCFKLKRALSNIGTWLIYGIS